MEISAQTRRPYDDANLGGKIPNIAGLPDDALLTDRQKAAHSGFTVQAFKKWRREGRGPATIYVEGRPRSTVRAYRDWIAGARS